MKVFDCFTFFNELELLELRLESYYDIVDRFVIVEADKTHANIPKPFNFLENIDRYQKYLPKIKYVMDTSVVPYAGAEDWSIENNQRNSIMKGLDEAEPDDLILISDVDEFPNPEILKTLIESFCDPSKDVDCFVLHDTRPFTTDVTRYLMFTSTTRISSCLNMTPIIFQQRFFTYFFDLVSPQSMWGGTVVSKFKHITSPQELRDIGKETFPRIANGGWHFSSMGGVDTLLEKARSGADFKKVSAVDPRYLDKDFLFNAMMNGEYLLGGGEFVHFDISEIKLPALPAFLKKYPHFLRENFSSANR